MPAAKLNRNWADRELKTFRVKRLVAAFNKKRLYKNCSARLFKQEDWRELAMEYRGNDSDVNISRTKSLLKNERVIKIADEQLVEALDKTGVTKSWLLEQRKVLLEQSFKEKDRRMAHVTLSRLEDIAGMSPIIITQGNTSTETKTVDYEQLDKKAEIAHIEGHQAVQISQSSSNQS